MKLHADAACSIDRLLARHGARDKDDSLPDAMLAMSDYSAAVEGAPEAISVHLPLQEGQARQALEGL